MKLSSITPALLLCASAIVVKGVGFNDTFDSIDPAWGQDRYAPAVFQTTFFDGDNRLEIGVDAADGPGQRPGSYSSAFYNTQGMKRDATISGPFTISADLYVDDSFVAGNDLRRTGLWARTGNVGTELGADYPIFDLMRFDPDDPFNPTAANLMSTWRIWDPSGSATGWVNVAAPVTTGWNNLKIVGGLTGYSFLLNDVEVYSDLTVMNPESLTTVFIDQYNFGSTYSTFWDNLSVSSTTSSVPDQGSTAALMASVLVGIGIIRRRRQRSGAV